MKPRSNGKQSTPPALVALRRAAKAAQDLARKLGTSCHVLQDGKIVDIGRVTPAAKKKRRSS